MAESFIDAILNLRHNLIELISLDNESLLAFIETAKRVHPKKQEELSSIFKNKKT